MPSAETLRRRLEHTRDLDDPAMNARLLVPSDTDECPPTRGIYVGYHGQLTVVLWGDDEPVSFQNIAPGVVHPLAIKKVMATGTDEDMAIIGLW